MEMAWGKYDGAFVSWPAEKPFKLAA